MKSTITRKLSISFSGSLLSQGILLASAPILTRLFDPASLGTFYGLWAVIGIFALAATLQLEHAILIPDSESESFSLFCSTIFIVLISCMVSFAAYTAYSAATFAPIFDVYGHNSIVVILSILVLSMYQIFYLRANRFEQFGLIARAKVTLALTVVIVQIGLGVLADSSSHDLLFAQLLGSIAGLLILMGGARVIHAPKHWKPFNLSLIYRYRRFPLFLLPANLLNTGARQLPVILIAWRFGVVDAGLYALVQKSLSLPISVIGASAADVFRSQARLRFSEQNSCTDLHLSFSSRLAIAGLIPLSLVWLFGEQLFMLVFGEEWRAAGAYAIILMPMYVCQLISVPTSTLITLRQRQKQYFYLQLIIALAVTAIFLRVNTIELALVVYSGFFIMIYAVIWLWCFLLSKGMPISGT